jgi:hypothetical protein
MIAANFIKVLNEQIRSWWRNRNKAAKYELKL